MLNRVAILILLLVLVACSGPDGTATSTTTSDPSAVEPTVTAGQPVEPEATPTGEPTDADSTSTPTPTTTPSDPGADPTATDPPVEPTPTETSEESTQEPASPMGPEELLGGIDRLVEGRTGEYMIVVIGPDGQPEYRLNDQVQVQAASLYKLLIMVEVFRQVEDGLLTLDQPVRLLSGFFTEAGFDDPFDESYIDSDVSVGELVRPMVMFSSNVAAFALLDLVGNSNVNATAEALGLTLSEIRWMPTRYAAAPDVARYAQVTPEVPDVDDAFNVTSAADMALLLQMLIEGRVVSPEASQTMLEIMTGQVVNDRLPALLPAGVAVAHKTGNIDNVIHDAGVIYTPNGPAVVVVLTTDALEWEAVELMQELALLVYQYGDG